MIDLGPRFPPLVPWQQLIARRALVVAPHADDEVICAGGTLALAAAAGVELRVLHLSDGAAGDPEGRFPDLAVRRREESDAALRCLGLAPAIELGFADGTLHARLPEIARRLADELAAFAPETVIALSPLEAHPDHRVAAEALRRALREVATVREVLWAGVNSPIHANALVDTTAALTRKDAAMACYASQIAYNDIRTKVRSLDGSRTVNVDLPDVRACEAFLRLARERTDELFAAAAELERVAFGGER